ncbi:putative virion structural protein [Erwinia phage pEa_SNUABM_8]|nr:putative virion structural protein [Erwinia phage pEa_SNUABM_8]QVW54930.1 hypothetical protein pEaSNUABM4_00177 [Erwinia phage pEa_SNUABM_4]
MALKLKWKNPNKGATTVDIYRGDTANVDLTTPLVSLLAGELEWIDTTALFGKTYYYVWAVNTANDRVVSRPQKIEVNDRQGPGPNLLMHGSESYGYFGTVPSADFVNSSAIFAALKSMSGIPNNIIYPTWHKFIRNGKVLFVPDNRIGDVTWNNLYAAGAVYGTNDNGPSNSPGNVNQLCTFELNGDLFLVRAPKAVPDGMVWDNTAVDLDTLPAAKDIYSEYEDIFFPLIAFTPLRQRMVNVAEMNPQSILPTGSGNDRTSIGVCCQEVASATAAAQRGIGSYNWASSSSRDQVRNFSLRGRTSANVWWPIVEYIGRVGEVDLAHI